MIVRMEAVVHGKVQGVTYRQFVRDNALKLGLVGHAENRDDGTVFVAAEGELEILEKLVKKLHHGPLFAHVSKVEALWYGATGRYSGFTIR